MLRAITLALAVAALVAAPAFAQKPAPKDDAKPAAPGCQGCDMPGPPCDHHAPETAKKPKASGTVAKALAKKTAQVISTSDAGRVVASVKTAKDDAHAGAALLRAVPQLGPKAAVTLAKQLRATDSWKACLTRVVDAASACRTLDKATCEKLFATKKARHLAETVRDCKDHDTAVLVLTSEIKALDDDKVASTLVGQLKSAKTLDAAASLLQVTAARFGGATWDGKSGCGTATACGDTAAKSGCGMSGGCKPAKPATKVEPKAAKPTQ